MSTNRTEIVLGARYPIVQASGAAVTSSLSEAAEVRHMLPRDMIVVCADVARDMAGKARVRISSPAGWVDADSLGPAEPPLAPPISFETFLDRHLMVSPGDFYGLDFPFTFDKLQAFGPQFLTAAFHASGYLPEDNSVTAIVAIAPLNVRGASQSAFLTLSYDKADPALSTELFLKIPTEEPGYKYYQSRGVPGEMEMGRFSMRGTLPVDVPRCCFAEYSSHTMNFILITERVPFGVEPVEPAHRKGYDFKVPAVEDHYAVLARALGRLVSAHKTGEMGHDVERLFPFAAAARNFGHVADVEARIDRLIDFVNRVAPQLFIPQATDPAFLKRWRDDLLFGMIHHDEVVAYLNSDPDYVALCHPNLNVDNAWYWRDETGALQVGLIDWGSAGQISIAQALSGMLMMLDPEKHLFITDLVIATFLEEYDPAPDAKISLEELKLQYKASLYSSAISIILSQIVEILHTSFSEDTYKSMQDRYDERLLNSQLCSCINWIDNLLREWQEPVTPGQACRMIIGRKEITASAA